MHSIRFVFFGIALAAVLVTQSAVAKALAPAPTPHQLVITENPSDDLIVTYDGSAGVVSIVQDAPGVWVLFFPSGVIFPTTIPTWVEPESSALMNLLRRSQGARPILQVVSDVAASGHPAPNGATVSFGTDHGVPISVTFFDHATATTVFTTVPETGSTLALLCISLTALFSASCVRSLRLA